MSAGLPTFPSLIHQQFTDFDQFSESARGWQIDFIQMDRGEFRGSLSHLLTPNVFLSKVVLGRKIIQQGQIPPGFRTFAYAADSHLDLRWRGKDLGSEELMIFPRGQGLESVSKPGFSVYVLSVSDWLLSGLAEARGMDSADQLFPDSDVVRLRSARGLSLRHLSEKLLQAGIDQPDLLSHWGYRESLELELVEALLSAVSGSLPVKTECRLTRARRSAVNRARELMTQHASRGISIAEIEMECGVSPRTLRYGFQEAFGVSPKSFLSALRLNRVRHELYEGSCRSVAQAAQQWGFWHMGQFAKDYRRLFGELPSKTLRVR